MNATSVSAEEHLVGKWDVKMTVTSAPEQIEKAAKATNKDNYGRSHFFCDFVVTEDYAVTLERTIGIERLDYSVPVQLEYENSQVSVFDDVDMELQLAWDNELEDLSLTFIRFDGKMFEKTYKNPDDKPSYAADSLITIEGNGSFDCQLGTVDFEFIMKPKF